MTDNNKPAEMKLISSRAETPDLHGDGSMLFTVLKKAAKLAAEEAKAGDTNAGVSVGKKAHLIEKLSARDLRDFNATHAICIDAKVRSTVGLGHREQDIHDTLDPLTRFSWQDTLNALAEDSSRPARRSSKWCGTDPSAGRSLVSTTSSRRPSTSRSRRKTPRTSTTTSSRASRVEPRRW